LECKCRILEKKYYGTSHLKNIRQGFIKQAITDAKAAYNGIKAKFTQTHTYGDGSANLTLGVVPNTNPVPEANPAVAIKVVEEIIQEYGSLLKKAASGDDKAIDALGFEAALIALPESEEVRAFKYESQVLRSGKAVDVFSTNCKKLCKRSCN